MQVLNKFNIDMAKKTAPTVIYAMQNDVNTRTVEIHLFSNSSPWNVPNEITVAVAFQKPDNHKGLYDELPNGDDAIAVSGNTITAILAPQVLTCSGQIRVAIVLMDENLNRIATFPFFVEAEIDPSGGSDVSNDYYKYSTMEEVSEAVESALSELETSKQDFLDKALEALEVVKDTATEDSPAIICEETGEIISVSDSSNRTLAGLTLYGKTTQNGTPTPENPVELVSVGESGAITSYARGKNLYNLSKGYAHLAPQPIYIPANTPITVAVLPSAGTMQFNLTLHYTNGETYHTAMFGRNHVNGKWYKVNLPLASDGITGVSFYDVRVDGETSRTIDKIIVMVGTIETMTDAEYEPFIGQTLTASTPNGLPGIPVSSGGNYTDENGQQWICDEIDFARGVYVKRVGNYVFNGSEAWEVQNNTWFIHRMSDAYTDIDPLFMSNVGRVPQANLVSGYGFAYAYGARIKFENMNPMSGNTVDELKAYLAEKPITMVVRLKTPIETALSEEELTAYAALHTNKPNTTVYNDAGAGLKLAYNADTKAYIDNKFTELQNAILSAGANI